MRSNKLLRGFIILGLLVVCMQNIQAQALNTATIRETVEFWKELQNPVQIGYGNDPWINLTMPFTFSYDNQNITQIYIYGNGYIRLNAAGNPSGLAVPDFAGMTNTIYWYGKDLFTQGTLSFKVEGATPFRVLTIQQLGARFITDQTGATFDAQIKFYETTNEIQVIYGNTAGLGGGGVNGWLGFVGSVTSRYINIQPRQPELSSILYYNPGNPNNQPWLAKSVIQYFPVGRSFTLSTSSRIADVFPNSNTVLTTGKVYTGNEHPHVRISRSQGQPDIRIKYTINGPVGNSKLIYTALNVPDITGSDTVNPNPQPLGNLIRVDMPYAKDLAGVLENGALNLTNSVNTPSGVYNVQAILLNAAGTVLHTVNSQFTIAFPNDLAIMKLEAPVDSTGSIYSYSGQTPVQVVVKNQGSNSVDELKIEYTVYDLATNNAMKSESVTFDLSSNPLLFNESRIFNMPRYLPTKVGAFKIVVKVSNPTVFNDDIPENNIYPKTTSPNHVFIVGYETEAQPVSMISPTSPVYVNRPFRPAIRVQNNGVSDISSVPATFTIKKNGNELYKETIIIDDVPSGLVKYVNVYFPLVFIPTETGIYDVEILVDAQSDEVPSNNLFKTTFNVVAGLKGTYTISTAAGANFKTITEATQALYKQGVVGAVTFLLNDAVYNEGNVLFNEPAIDFSSKIIGINSENTVTFTVNPLNANYGSVVVNLNTANGIGILFGQNTMPKYPEATVYNVTASAIKNYASSNGYIIFDGGAKKSIVMNLKTTSAFRSVFYLANGASNITVKNIIIKDGVNQAPSYLCRIPLTVYNAATQSFTYETNLNVSGTFSAGVLLRSIPPKDAALGNNVYGLDTLLNMHNTILNNEISNFGYGIVSLGIGSLYNPGMAGYKAYYNGMNKFNGNKIFDVSKAGVYLGFEKASEVYRNRIYNVTSTCDGTGSGIALGGEMRPGWFGYHNIDIFISSNEVSNISALNNVYGIKIEQSHIEFVDKDDKYSFPNEDERIRVVNNIIWGLTPNNTNTNVFGVLLMTERSAFNWSAMTLTPAKPFYFSRGDYIVNNTINFEDDGINNKGAIAAVALLNNTNTTFYNNAIAVSDKIIDASSPFMASLFMYSTHPRVGSIVADRNAYWFGSSNATIVRFVELDNNSNILEAGYKNEFFTIDQWQQWTKQDLLSVVGDWTKDYTTFGNAPYTYRVKNSPMPLNSILNNRGKNIAENPVDIDGNFRGLVGERYDIGAVEFSGMSLSRDMEVIGISEPGRYKATPGMAFDDAEYIMTTSPVNVISNVRSNGLMIETNTKVNLKIYRQNPTGAWDQELNVDSNIEELFFSDNAKINFKLADGINNPPSNPEFFPKTYGDLKNLNYTIPPQFQFMVANVTPLYKLVVSVPFDEYNANNKWEKVVRFYIQKSPISLMVSAENIMPITKTSPLENIASNLNLDTLVKGFNYLGWRIDLNLEQPKIDIDIFDRMKWEPRSIDYTIYRSLFWVDAHDTKADGSTSLLRRTDRENISSFLNSGSVEVKKNFVIASQEIVRNESQLNAPWVKNVLNAKAATPNNPAGPNGSYNNLRVKGVKLAINQYFTINSTLFENDEFPKAGLFDMSNAGFGESRIGFQYEYHYQDDPLKKIVDSKRISSIATTTIPYNVIYLGIDWRHWGDIQKVLRAIIDYVIYEGGTIVPVELLSFDANQAGKRVDLSWTTASEKNAGYFEIQKANVNTSGITEFTTISNERAIGNSSVTTYYGPIADKNVEYGNMYAYRLKMVDNDGSFSYSETKFVSVSGLYSNIQMTDVTPNPVSNSSTFDYTLTNAQPVKISIFDNNGNEVMVLFDGNQSAGTFTMNIKAADLTSGTYTVVLNSNDILLMKRFTVIK